MYWVHPALGRFKCNTDVTNKGNPGLGSTSFFIRNEEGYLIFAEDRSIENCSTIVKEMKAFKAGLKYCIDNGLLPLITETDYC